MVQHEGVGEFEEGHDPVEPSVRESWSRSARDNVSSKSDRPSDGGGSPY